MPRARKLIPKNEIELTRAQNLIRAEEIFFPWAKISTKDTKKLNLHVKLNECIQNPLSGYQNKIYLISTVMYWYVVLRITEQIISYVVLRIMEQIISCKN